MFILSTILAVGLVLLGVVQAAVEAGTTITLAPLVVTFVVGLLIPVIVGVVTKSGASVQLKQVITIVLAGIAALINAGLTGDGGSVFTVQTFLLAALTWGVSITSYLGIYKPVGLNEHTAPDAGLGSIDTTAVERTQ